jgi:signal transduction histidine kinase
MSEDISNRNEKIEILHGTENIIDRTLGDLVNVRQTFDNCTDYTGPSVFLAYQPVWDACIALKQKGIRLRFITEITRDNINYCKEVMKVFELRHLDGIKGNFGIADGKDYGGAARPKEAEVPALLIRSNVRAFVEQQQYFFETLWAKSIPAEQRIKEIEEGRAVHYETKVLTNEEEIVDKIKDLLENSNELFSCSRTGGLQLGYDRFLDLGKEILARSRRAEHKGIKLLTAPLRDTVQLVKVLLDLGIQVRETKNMPPLNFAVTDKEVHITIDKMEGGRMIRSVLVSNEPIYVNHFRSIFEELWRDGIDAAEGIKDLERGMQSDIEVIPNSARAAKVYLNLVKAAKEEIMIIFPTTGAFVRQSKLGVTELAKEAARLSNARVRILMPASNLADQMTLDLKRDYPTNFDIRCYVEQTSAAKATILVVDRKDSLVMELRDDSTTTFEEAIGFSTHSNSRPGVLSYVAIFENIWMQTEIFEELKAHERMQREFINVAAHELRTPIQPILGLTELLRSQIKDVKQREFLDITIRNAKRLQRLTEDILDVTKVETKSLGLKKELFDLNEMIMNAISDSKNQISKENKSDKLTLELMDSKESIITEADKGRINQVISNLLNNAIKFTNEGSISISVEKKKDNENEEKYKEVIISVKDTGTGIDLDIFPRLFTKFATRSAVSGGTGLGLFISKGIVEAHGGRIWAVNNKDGKGATFSFTIPANA